MPTTPVRPPASAESAPVVAHSQDNAVRVGTHVSALLMAGHSFEAHTRDDFYPAMDSFREASWMDAPSFVPAGGMLNTDGFVHPVVVQRGWWS